VTCTTFMTMLKDIPMVISSPLNVQMLTGLSMASYALVCVPFYHVPWPRCSQEVSARAVSVYQLLAFNACLQTRDTTPSSPLTLHELHVADCLLSSSYWTYSRANITLLDTEFLCSSINGLPSSCMATA
jgi:hypothetical protein